MVSGFLLQSCSDPDIQEADFFVFGTLVQVSLADVEPDLAARAFTDLQSRLQAMHSDWHAWEAGRLTEINQAFAGGNSAKADPQIVELVQLSQWAERQSQGRFNAAIGGLVGLWGFHTSDFPIMGPLPAAGAISRLVEQHPSAADISLVGDPRDGLLSSSNPAVQLDLGGIAKGYAVDLACARLRELGVHNAIVNAGGDLRAFGRQGPRPWRVAIRNPFGGVLGGVEIRADEAVFTSGNYQRFRETDSGERYPHILDPRTGWPAKDVMSATVVAETGWLADAAATALVVAGLSEWPAVAVAMGVDKVLITDEAGTVYVSPELSLRFEWASDTTPVIVAVEE